MNFQKSLFDTNDTNHPDTAVLPPAENEPKKRRGRPAQDLTGRRFGMLTVEAIAPEKYNNERVYICRCDCGCTIKAAGSHLKRKTHKLDHCGCKGAFRNGKSAPGQRGIGGWNMSKQVIKNNPKTALNSLYANYRTGATKRGYSFLLTKKQFYELTQQNCHYCNASPSSKYSRGEHSLIYNGVDRKDNDKGYTPDNTLPCCGVCNQAKSDMAYNDFLEWVEKVYTHIFLPPTI